MRSTPALTDSSKTRREPAMLRSRVDELASRIANARCTTTCASLTRSRTVAASVTSPRRYSVLRQPRSAGSKGRRAMPMTRLTARERSSASTIPSPRSPVGPVTATVRPVLVTYAVLPDSGGARADRLAPAQDVDRIGEHAVVARAALNAVAVLVLDLDRVVAGAAVDRVAARPSADLVAVGAGANPVVAAAPGDRGPADSADLIVAGTGADRDVALIRVDAIRAGAGVDEVGPEAGVDVVVARAAEEPVRAGLPEQRVPARAAEHEIVSRAGVDHVVAGPRVDVVVAGAADDQVQAVCAFDVVVSGARLEVVVGAE